MNIVESIHNKEKFNRLTQPAENKINYVTWDKSKATAIASYSTAINSSPQIQRSVGSYGDRFAGIDGNVSVRTGMTWADYEYFRPNESTPYFQKELMGRCNAAYENVGIVTNIVDLMTDFTVQGIRLVCTNKKYERFYRMWAKEVKMKETSSEMINNVLVMGNAVIKRSTAKLDLKTVREYQKSVGVDLELRKPQKLENKEIPLRYTLWNPMCVDVVGEELSMLSDRKFYAVTLGKRISTLLGDKTTKEMKEYILSDVPADLRDAVQNDKPVLFSDEKVKCIHYKKRHWKVWARPMIAPVMRDIIMLEKLKLADIAALDGVISHIRIWKVGNIEHGLLPDEGVFARLANALNHHVGGGTMDFIWGPDIELLETNTETYKFLGSEKYGPTLSSIYAGLGIPPTLTGQQGGSFTNNFIALKTLIERLNYLRDKLIEFWEAELKLVQKAMGFSSPAKILFDFMSFSDEAADKALWIQLADRGIISEESVQERFGRIPEIENVRIKREHRSRKRKNTPYKASPFHDADPELSLKKIALQRGTVTPSEVGLELDERKEGEISQMELQEKMNKQKLSLQGPKGQPGQGRPKNSKDSTKRKQKRVLPRSKGEEFVQLAIWAKGAQDKIGEITHAYFLSLNGKKNLRQLTNAQVSSMEHFKFNLLLNLKPFVEITKESITKVLSNKLPVYEIADRLYVECRKNFSQTRKCEPTLDEIRQMYANIYASMNIEPGEDDD